jgi:hypothetical protein
MGASGLVEIDRKDAASAAASVASSSVVGRRTSERLKKKAEAQVKRLLASPDRPKREGRAAVTTVTAAGSLSLSAAADGIRSWQGIAKWYRRSANKPDPKGEFAREVQAYEVLNAAHCPGVLLCVASRYPYVLLDGVGDRVTKLVVNDIEPLLHTIKTMHSCGVMHLDIRLSNLVRHENRITVIDFTCSVRTRARLSCRALTSSPVIRCWRTRRAMAVVHRAVHRMHSTTRGSCATPLFRSLRMI